MDILEGGGVDEELLQFVIKVASIVATKANLIASIQWPGLIGWKQKTHLHTQCNGGFELISSPHPENYTVL